MTRIATATYVARTRTRDAALRLRYARQLRTCGDGVRFGGRHITIDGGRGEVGRGITIGSACTIYDYCVLVTDDYTDRCGIEIGANTHLNFGTYIFGTGGVTIGSGCLLGPRVSIVGANHRFDDGARPIIGQGHDFAEVVIEDGAWLGMGAIVLPGACVEAGAVVAAGAVVTGRVPAGMVVAGVPARVLRARGVSRTRSGG